MIGGVLGAYVLTQISAATARPWVLAYLTAIGFYLLWRGASPPPAAPQSPPRRAARAGRRLPRRGRRRRLGAGGDLATCSPRARIPRKVIGTVNTAEFFIALTISFTFLLTLSAEAFTTPMLGLLIGGLAAAPLGGLVAKRLPARPLLIMVGVVLILTSAYGIWRSLA